MAKLVSKLGEDGKVAIRFVFNSAPGKRACTRKRMRLLSATAYSVYFCTGM